jgi:hypothetical protein
MSSLYTLTEQQRELTKLVESGEISKDDTKDTFEGMQGELNDKINDYLFVRRNMIGMLDNIETEIKRLEDLKKVKKNQIKDITDRLKNGLEGIGQTNFDTGLFKGHFRKGAASLKVHKPDMVPDEYVQTEIKEKVNTTELKKAISSGDIILANDVAEIVHGESSLIIK